MGTGWGSLWWEALGSPVSVGAGAAAVGLAVAGAVLLRAVARLGRDERRRWVETQQAQPAVPVGMLHGSGSIEATARASGEGGESPVASSAPWPSARKGERVSRGTDGTATIEFALTLPILLFVVLALTQTMLLMGGNLLVHYSAFAATRSAIVQIPAAYPGEPANTYRPDSRKHDAIFRSAVFALLPVCGREPIGVGGATAGRISPEPVVAGFRRFFEGYGEPAPGWVDTRLAERVAYGAAHTRVRVTRAVPVASADAQGPGDGRRPGGGAEYVRFEPIEAEGRVSAREAIAVRVEHRLNLPIPYVNRLFASGAHANGRDRYIALDARAVLTNEGVMDDLPPEPALPRIPRE